MRLIKQLSLHGLRGFSTPQTLFFAIPSGVRGSGLTILVGPNNSGKSTIIEGLRCFCVGNVSFDIGKRNERARRLVELNLVYGDDEYAVIKTASLGSETIRTPPDFQAFEEVLILPSRRFFDSYFPKGGNVNRRDFSFYLAQQDSRNASLTAVTYRLVSLQNDANKRRAFDNLLASLAGHKIDWYIEQTSRGDYSVQLMPITGLIHDTSGAGDGLISLLFIANAFFEAEPNNIIVIDEPELSLHPAVQRRLADYILEQSQDKQIIVATHSPYFLPASYLGSGMQVSRVYATADGTQIKQISKDTSVKISRVLTDLNNPHTFDIIAREAFFLDDGVILVEGQEDVIFYRKAAEQLGISWSGDFFGWGVGGAEKMFIFASMFRDLGFTKVIGILDADKENEQKLLSEQFPDYNFYRIPTDDVRDKPMQNARNEKLGLMKQDGTLKSDYIAEMKNLIESVSRDLSN